MRSDKFTGDIPVPDIKHKILIESFPEEFNFILNVGCGECAIDGYLAANKVKIVSMDIKDPLAVPPGVEFFKADLMDLSTIPENYRSPDVVLCSQVLEHLQDWLTGYRNLVTLFSKKLIITIPWQTSFHHPTHLRYWADLEDEKYRPVSEFVDGLDLRDRKISISRIYTKEIDKQRNDQDYMIEIEKTA